MSKNKYIKNGVINVWDYCNFEEDPKEFGKRIYVDVSQLADAARDEIINNKRYVNYDVELTGVRRWEW